MLQNRIWGAAWIINQTEANNFQISLWDVQTGRKLVKYPSNLTALSHVGKALGGASPLVDTSLSESGTSKSHDHRLKNEI